MPYIGNRWVPYNRFLGAAARRQQSPAEDLSEEEREGLLSRLKTGTVSGLSGVANLLDLPVSMIRDVVAGENPVDQFLSPFSSDNRVQMRDLLRRKGLVGEQDTWGNFGGSLVADIALDPLTYLTLGASAVGKAGKLAKAAGILDKAMDVSKAVGPRTARMSTTLGMLTKGDDAAMEAVKNAAKAKGVTLTDELMQEPLGSLGRWGPFQFGRNMEGTAGRVARLADIAGAKVRYSPPVRGLYGLFHQAMPGAFSETSQRALPGLGREADAGVARARMDFASLMADQDTADYFDIGSIAKAVGPEKAAIKKAIAGLPKDVTPGQLRGALEGALGRPVGPDDLVEDADKAARRILNERSNDFLDAVEKGTPFDRPDAPPGMAVKIQVGRDLLAKGLEYELASGLSTKELNDIHSHYWARVRQNFPDPTYFGKRGAMSPTHEFQKGRLDFLRHIRGGTRVVQEMSIDPEISGWAHKSARSIGRNSIDEMGAGVDAAVEGPFKAGEPTVSKAELAAKVDYVKRKYGSRLQTESMGEPIGFTDENLRDLTRWVMGLDPRHADLQVPAFDTNPWNTLSARLEAGARAAEVSRAMIKLTANNVVARDVLSPGRGKNALEMLQEMHGDVPTEQAKKLMLENVGDTPHLAAARQMAGEERGKVVGELRAKTEVKRNEMLARSAVRFGKFRETFDRALASVAKKQATLEQDRATDKMAGMLEAVLRPAAPPPLTTGMMRDAIERVLGRQITPADLVAGPPGGTINVLDPTVQKQMQAASGIPGAIDPFTQSMLFNVLESMNPPLAAATPQTLDPATLSRILNGIEAIKPEAIKSEVLTDFRDTVRGVLNPVIERMSDDLAAGRMGRYAMKEDAVQKLLDAATKVRSDIARELRASDINPVRNSLADLSEKLFKQADEYVGKAGSKFKQDIGEHAPLDKAAWEEGFGILQDADSLENLNLDALRGSFEKSLANLESAATERIAKSAEQVVTSSPYDEASAVLKNLYVPEDVAADAIRIMKGHIAPKALGPVAEVFDRVMRHWRTSMTSPWPAYHMRNLTGSHVNSFLAGAWSPVAFKQGYEIARGRKAITNANKVPGFEGMSPERATLELRKEMFAQNAVHPRQGYADVGSNRFTRLPGMGPVFSKAAAGTTVGQQFNPLSTETFWLFRMGADVGQFVETWNRATPYIYLRTKGWSPEAAAKRVAQIQVDYTKHSAADPVMRRIFPFWTFSSRMVPYVMQELFEKPGGRLGQAIRASGRLSDVGPTTPQEIAESMSVPIEGGPEGGQRYLTSFGLMHEDPLSFLGGGLQGTLMELASRLTPGIKFPLEYATQETFFQKGPEGGRPLGDLDPTIGRLVSNVKDVLTGTKTERAEPILGSPLLEAVLANSPLQRIATTSRMLTDPRKYTTPGGPLPNILTGVRFADVSPARQDAILQDLSHDYMKRYLRGREFTKMWIPDEEIQKMPVSRQKIAKDFNALMNDLAKRKKERNKNRSK